MKELLIFNLGGLVYTLVLFIISSFVVAGEDDKQTEKDTHKTK